MKFNISYKLGNSINNYIKSYGTFWIRRRLVNFICCVLAQIDEKEYCKCRNTPIYRKIDGIKLKVVSIK